MPILPLRQLGARPDGTLANEWIEQLREKLDDPSTDRALLCRQTLCEIVYPQYAASWETAVEDTKLTYPTRLALSALAAAVHGHPSHSLTIAGVTGTDGKTTTSTMLWAAWRAAGLRAGLISTVDFRDGDNVVPNTTRQTTMEAVETHRRLAALRDSGCTHVVVETSSHGLEMHRVDHVDYRLAVYTRITSEHLDVHGDRSGYLAAKARLLELVGPLRLRPLSHGRRGRDDGRAERGRPEVARDGAAHPVGDSAAARGRDLPLALGRDPPRRAPGFRPLSGQPGE